MFFFWKVQKFQQDVIISSYVIQLSIYYILIIFNLGVEFSAKLTVPNLFSSCYCPCSQQKQHYNWLQQ